MGGYIATRAVKPRRIIRPVNRPSSRRTQISAAIRSGNSRCVARRSPVPSGAVPRSSGARPYDPYPCAKYRNLDAHRGNEFSHLSCNLRRSLEPERRNASEEKKRGGRRSRRNFPIVCDAARGPEVNVQIVDVRFYCVFAHYLPSRLSRGYYIAAFGVNQVKLLSTIVKRRIVKRLLRRDGHCFLFVCVRARTRVSPPPPSSRITPINAFPLGDISLEQL